MVWDDDDDGDDSMMKMMMMRRRAGIRMCNVLSVCLSVLIFTTEGIPDGPSCLSDLFNWHNWNSDVLLQDTAATLLPGPSPDLSDN